MGSVLERLVRVRVSKGSGPITRKDSQRTHELRDKTGDNTYKVTNEVYPTKPFASIVAAQTEFMDFIKTRKVACGTDGEGFVSVSSVNDIRQKYAEASIKLANLCSELASRRDQIVLEQIKAKNGNVSEDDYPSILPLAEWFYLSLEWLPHPQESPLSKEIATAESAMEAELRQEMEKGFARQVEAARDDLIRRVSDTMGQYVRKMMRLRTDVRVCPKCEMQWEASQGDTCPRCKALQDEIIPRSERLVGSTVTNIAGLCEELKAIIPPEVLDPSKIETALKPVLDVKPLDVKFASKATLQMYESDARQAAQEVAGMIIDSFK